MAIAENLEKASSVFFFGASSLSKLQYLPFPLASLICRFTALALFLFAYGLWFIASYFYPDHKKHDEKWYGFAQVKQQFMYSSLIGLTATLLSIGACFFPPLLLPAVWLYLVGNIFWTIGEYHRFKNPALDDSNFSSTRQKDYFSYSITTTSMTLIAALASSFIYFFPLMVIPIAIVSLIVCAGLGALALEFWLSFTFGKHSQTPPENVQEMTEVLNLSNAPTPKESPEPVYGFSLLSKQPSKNSIKDPLEEIKEIQKNNIERMSNYWL